MSSKGAFAIAGLAMMLFSFVGIGHAADIIYADTFGGTAGDFLNGRTLNTASGLDGGTAGATWSTSTTTIAGGNSTTPSVLWQITGSNSASVGTTGVLDAGGIVNCTLPFVPQTGFVYDLHLQMNPSGTGASGNWPGLAFTNANFGTHTPGGTASALSNDNPYGLIIAKGTGAVQSFAGVGTANQILNLANGSEPVDAFTTYDVVLDTTPANWTVKWLFNGVVQPSSTFTYPTNPTIGLVAFGTNKLSATVQDFSLTAVPEPSSLILAGCGLIGLVRLARRRK